MKQLLFGLWCLGAVSGSWAQDSTSSVRVLAEVTVSGRSPTLRTGPDKKVFAVNQSLVSVGGTAADLLQNVPTLQVDANGTVSLRGATDVVVLVDGKRSVVGGGSAAQVLQSIPAGSIDRVEIITHPSAKYDAEGQAVINIVLKKHNAAGWNGSAAVTGGTRGNYNATASLSHQHGKVDWYANYSYQHRNTYSNGFQDMTYLQSADSVRYSHETFPSVSVTDLHSAKAGLDYAASPRDKLSLTGALNASTRVRNEWLTVDNLTAGGSPALLSTRDNSTDGNEHSYELTVDYTHTFRNPLRTLSLDADVADGVTHQQQVYGTYVSYPVDSAAALQDIKATRSRNYNFQLDFTDGHFEAGLRSQIRVGDNQEWDYDLEPYAPEYGFTNFFNSTTQVHAAYLTYRRQIRSVSIQVGLRGELGRFDGHLQSFDSLGRPVLQQVPVNTLGLYPSLSVIKQLSGGRRIQLNYSRRVLRPTPGELDPFFDISDPVNYDAGNPRLLPESVHSAELAYAFAGLTAGAYYTQVNDVIKHVQTVPVDDVTYTIAANLKRSINTGFEFIGHVQPVKAWGVDANVNVYERINTGDSAYGISATHGLSWNANVTNNIAVGHALSLQVRADYFAKDKKVQDLYRPAWGIDAAAKYDFWHKRASLSLNGRDIFNTRRWRFLRESDALALNFERVTYSARGSLTFAYRFGSGGTKSRAAGEAPQNARIENR